MVLPERHYVEYRSRQTIRPLSPLTHSASKYGEISVKVMKIKGLILAITPVKSIKKADIYRGNMFSLQKGSIS
jgi:hypothetical protein